MATIELGGRRGGVTLVDDADLAMLASASWHVGALGYVRGRYEGKVQDLHRVIARPPKGYVVDHRNGDKLDNRRANLRVCLQRENARNCSPKKNNTSGVVGVSWDKSRERWLAHIKVNRKFINLGWHDTLDAAAAARAAGEKKHFGEFAYRLNPRAVIEVRPLQAEQVDLLGAVA